MNNVKHNFGNYYLQLLDTDRPEQFYELVKKNRPRLEDFFSGTVARTLTLESTKEYCLEINEKLSKDAYIPFYIFSNDATKPIGLVDFKNINMKVPKAELGYFIDLDYEGQGVVSQAVSVIISHMQAQYKFKKLLCRIGTQNKGSAGVALKNGFELEGTIRYDYMTTRGELVDLNYFGRVFS